MSTVIVSVLVPLSIAAVAFAVDKIEQGTTAGEKETKEKKVSEKDDRDKGPGGLVDLSGGMLGIL